MCIQGIVDCTCPPEEKIEDMPSKPLKPSPVDCLGYPPKCCYCCRLKIAVIFICILSFMWAMYELTQSEQFMGSIFPNKDALFKYAKVVHIFLITCFLISCGVLMLGIIVHKFMPFHIYVWTAFIFNCICITLTVASIAAQVITTGNLAKKNAMNLGFGVVWYCIFFYLLSVVNSYKFRITWI